jgi:hypothetical protein
MKQVIKRFLNIASAPRLSVKKHPTDRRFADTAMNPAGPYAVFLVVCDPSMNEV